MGKIHTSRTGSILLTAVILMIAAGCGGGSSGAAKLYAGCSEEGATAVSADNVSLKCINNTAGELMWDRDSEVKQSANGQYPKLNEVFGGECDASGPTAYSAGIGEASQMSHIVPLGAMESTHITPIDHIYVYYPQGSDGSASGTFTVSAPADGAVVTVEDFQVTNDYPYPDYRVVIEHSCDLYSVFIHVGELQGALAEAAQAAKSSGSWQGRIAVKAGEVVADESAHPGYDFSTFATKAKQTLLNEASYIQMEAWKPYTANPFDFFPANIRSAYEEKTLRTTSPLGGEIFYDKKDTAQGVWFVQGTNGYRGNSDPKASFNNRGKIARGYWDTHLAFAPHNIDPSAFIYSIGDWEGCPCQFMSVGNVDPSSITVGDPVVVDLVEYENLTPGGQKMDPQKPVRGYKVKPGTRVVGSLAIQLLGDGSLKIEKRPGKDAKSFAGFTSAALTYVR